MGKNTSMKLLNPLIKKEKSKLYLGKKSCMISAGERSEDCWMNIGSPDFIPEQRSRGYLETRRHGSSGIHGHKKNNLRMLWRHLPESLRQEEAVDTGFVLWGCPDLSGGGGASCLLPEMPEGETGAFRLAGRQSILHQEICVLCRSKMLHNDAPGVV